MLAYYCFAVNLMGQMALFLSEKVLKSPETASAPPEPGGPAKVTMVRLCIPLGRAIPTCEKSGGVEDWRPRSP